PLVDGPTAVGGVADRRTLRGGQDLAGGPDRAVDVDGVPVGRQARGRERERAAVLHLVTRLRPQIDQTHPSVLGWGRSIRSAGAGQQTSEHDRDGGGQALHFEGTTLSFTTAETSGWTLTVTWWAP